MWKLTVPAITALQALERCSAIADDRQVLVRRSAGEIVAASSAYVAAARSAQIHTLRSDDFRLTHLSGDEMEWLYKNRLYRGPGRDLYELIKIGARQRECPMCGVREVRDLDHVLPKSSFAALAIDPNNLVPVCPECNNVKREYFPSSATEQFIHPYFDDLGGAQWLRASILEDRPVAAFVFRVEPAATWLPNIAARVQWQFDKFKLAHLYASHAGRELARIRSSLNKIYSREGAAGVRFRLSEDADSRHADEINSWNTAMYEAMAASEWFCSGGFALTG